MLHGLKLIMSDTRCAGTHDCQQHHPQLVQAAVEERLRGAYRAMLLQLQHRYATECERQEEAHKLQLQEQVRACNVRV